MTSVRNPDRLRSLPYMRHPYSRRGGRLVLDRTVAARWEAGFGGLPRDVRAHARALRALRALGIEYGTRDDLAWLPEGCRYLSSVLDANGVQHELVAFDGGHDDRLGERLTGAMLPFFSKALAPE